MTTVSHKLRVSLRRHYKKEPERNSGIEKYSGRNKLTKGVLHSRFEQVKESVSLKTGQVRLHRLEKKYKEK